MTLESNSFLFFSDNNVNWQLDQVKPSYYPGQKKKNHPQDSRREERCSTCDIMLDHKRSAQRKVRSATLRDFCPALIPRHRAWYHTWNSVLLASNLEDSSFFFVKGSRRKGKSLIWWNDSDRNKFSIMTLPGDGSLFKLCWNVCLHQPFHPAVLQARGRIHSPVSIYPNSTLWKLQN